MRNQRVRLYGKMIRNVKLFSLSVVMVSALLILNGCKQRLLMDEDKCAEIALEYLEKKYGTEFIITYCSEQTLGGPIRVEIWVNEKYDEKDEDEKETYEIMIYPDGEVDNDGDGYYDNYIVISDSYMREFFTEFVSEEIDKIVTEIGVTEFISGSDGSEMNDKGFFGFSANFPIPNKKDASLQKVLNEYDVHINYWMDIPESQYYDELENDIIDKINPIVSGDIVNFYIVIFSDENYKREEGGEDVKLYEKKEEIEFSIGGRINE